MMSNIEVKKALAFIFRHEMKELLCFTHPVTNYLEVVRGTVEPNENPQDTVIRELVEEAGIYPSEIKNIFFAGDLKMQVKSGYDGKGNLQEQAYHGYSIGLINDNKPSWSHKVISDGIDNGHEYKFEWLPFNQDLLLKINPYTKIYMAKYFKIKI